MTNDRKPGDFTIDEKLAELDREIKMRHRVFPRMVARGQLTAAQSMHRLGAISAIARDYEAKKADGPLFNQSNAEDYAPATLNGKPLVDESGKPVIAADLNRGGLYEFNPRTGVVRKV